MSCAIDIWMGTSREKSGFRPLSGLKRIFTRDFMPVIVEYQLIMPQRILVVGRHQALMDRVTKLLETNAYIVTSTTNNIVALDLASTGEFDAVLCSEELSLADQASLRDEIRRNHPQIATVIYQGTDSVLTLLRQAIG